MRSPYQGKALGQKRARSQRCPTRVQELHLRTNSHTSMKLLDLQNQSPAGVSKEGGHLSLRVKPTSTHHLSKSKSNSYTNKKPFWNEHLTRATASEKVLSQISKTADRLIDNLNRDGVRSSQQAWTALVCSLGSSVRAWCLPNRRMFIFLGVNRPLFPLVLTHG